jgi:Tfp pilus assembly protein PilO
MRAELQTEYATLLKYRQFVRGARVTEEQLQAARRELQALKEGIITGVQKPLAFARLQLRLQEAARAAGLQSRTIRPLKAAQEGPFLSLPIFLEARGDMRALSEFLRSLDEPQGFMRIDSLMLSLVDVRKQKELRIKMQVSGLMEP